jgi:hypothetical protein
MEMPQIFIVVKSKNEICGSFAYFPLDKRPYTRKIKIMTK